MSWQTLEVTVGPVTTVRLNRPGKRNAQTLELWDELRRVGLALEDDPAVRVVVVSGAGQSFSAGIDLNLLLGAGGPAALPPVELVQQAFTWLREARFATVA
ncbi:MAG: enoyl-CoA hydratase/isomerase family protein, partial [Gemmatimonadales bacterium]